MKDTAVDVVAEAIHEVGTWDVDAIRENAQERIHDAADNACIYYAKCLEHIDELEREFGDAVEDMGTEYKAEDWREAMQAYAYQLVSAALNSGLEDAISEIEDNFELFSDEVERLGGDPDSARLGTDCEYGWEAHNYETSEGVMVWSAERDSPNGCFNPSLLEGELVAVSFKLCDGLYANLAWTPEAEDTEIAA